MTSGQMMDFPKSFDEFAKDYGFRDKQEVYTNGSELIPVFRVKQWLEHISTTKKDLGVDCISRAQTQTEIEMNASRYTIAKERGGMGQVEWSDQLIKVSDAVDIIRHLPSVTPQFSSGLEKNSKKLEKDFGELDCISRQAVLEQAYAYGNGLEPDGYCVNVEDIQALPSVTPQPCEDAVSRQEVLDLIADYDLSMGQVVKGIHALPPVTPQEPFKPMVEIDLDYVIKQKYIEREVLDKIRAEIETKYGQCDICEYFEDYDYEENDISEYRPIGNTADILQILDKYKAESEE